VGRESDGDSSAAEVTNDWNKEANPYSTQTLNHTDSVLLYKGNDVSPIMPCRRSTIKALSVGF